MSVTPADEEASSYYYFRCLLFSFPFLPPNNNSDFASRVDQCKLTEELAKVDEKLKLTESLLETKVTHPFERFCKTCAAKQIFVIIMCVYAKRVLQNLEAKRISDEKKAALAAQFAAEATLRRVHAAQKDDDMPPIEAILAPLEAELKLARQEVSKSPFFNLGVKMLACY